MKKRITTVIVGIVALFSILALIGIWLQGQLFRHGNVFLTHQTFAPHHRGHGLHHHDMMPNVGNHMFFLGDLSTLLLQLAIILAGIILWKTAKKGVAKWGGMTLLAVGLFMLLPKIVFIPLAILVAYLMFKSKKNDNDLSGFTYDRNGQVPTSHRNADFLDQWEQKMKMEG